MTSINDKRKDLSKKVRFEVFKRDSFKCQYCGGAVPDVTLEVDHIIPVSEGGTNDLINLITSCRECNAGKSNRMLDDDSVVVKQRKQLEEINERREQIQMMAEWRQDLMRLKEDQIDVINDILSHRTGRSFNNIGREKVRKLLSKYDMGFVCDCLSLAFDVYLVADANGFTQESIEKAINKWPGICRCKSEEKDDPDLAEIWHVVNWFCKIKNTSRYPKWRVFKIFKAVYDAGNSVDVLWSLARSCNTAWQVANVMEVSI